MKGYGVRLPMATFFMLLIIAVISDDIMLSFGAIAFALGAATALFGVAFDIMWGDQ